MNIDIFFSSGEFDTVVFQICSGDILTMFLVD